MVALAALVAIAVLAHSVVTGTAAAAAATATKGPVTYVFGDSMSDVGNNNYFPLSLAKSNYPWYGIDYPNGEATGRFTNGRTIGDYMGMCQCYLLNSIRDAIKWLERCLGRCVQLPSLATHPHRRSSPCRWPTTTSSAASTSRPVAPAF